MKVLLVNNFYHPFSLGGAERSVQVLAENLSTSGIATHVLSLCPKGNSQQVSSQDILNSVHCHYIDDNNWGLSPTDASRSNISRVLWHFSSELKFSLKKNVMARLEGIAPDIIHTNNLAGLSTSVWSAAKHLDIPVVHTLRDYYAMCFKGTMITGPQPCDGQCKSCNLLTVKRKNKAKLVSAVIGNSQFILDQHLDAGYFPSCLSKSVIYNSYSPDSLRPLKPENTSIPPVFGFIGRLHPSKGVEQMLEHVSQFVHSSAFTLLIAGEGTPLYERYLEQAFLGPRIQFLGWQSSEEFFKKIDCLIVPSLWHDPLPRVIFEAYHHGVPVIGADRGGITESIEHEVTGWLYEPTNSPSLGNIINSIIADPATLYSRQANAIKKAEDFSITNLISEYTAVYNSVLENN